MVLLFEGAMKFSRDGRHLLRTSCPGIRCGSVSLEKIRLLDTSNVTSMNRTFDDAVTLIEQNNSLGISSMYDPCDLRSALI